MIFIIKSGAGNSGTIGEVLNDSNCLSNARRSSSSRLSHRMPGRRGPGPGAGQAGRDTLLTTVAGRKAVGAVGLIRFVVVQATPGGGVVKHITRGDEKLEYIGYLGTRF
eukprot:767429-Hanusia_phi.AAC.4